VAEEDGDVEARSRRLVERMGMALQGACLVRGGNVAIADAFCESRIGRGHGVAFGTLHASAPMEVLIERAWAD
jgi:putative acyl-CoA dehydrogenase